MIIGRVHEAAIEGVTILIIVRMIAYIVMILEILGCIVMNVAAMSHCRELHELITYNIYTWRGGGKHSCTRDSMDVLSTKEAI